MFINNVFICVQEQKPNQHNVLFSDQVYMSINKLKSNIFFQELQKMRDIDAYKKKLIIQPILKKLLLPISGFLLGYFLNKKIKFGLIGAAVGIIIFAYEMRQLGNDINFFHEYMVFYQHIREEFNEALEILKKEESRPSLIEKYRETLEREVTISGDFFKVFETHNNNKIIDYFKKEISKQKKEIGKN